MAFDDGWKSENRAAEVLKQLQITRLPVDPFAIAAAKDILVQENPSLSSGISGCLMKVGDAFGIIYSSKFSSEGFKRFTVAHELGHYFLDGHMHELFGAGQELHKSESGFTSKNPTEREADAFAAGLLMPKSLFKPALDSAGSGLEAIESLADLCGTSLTATSIRYASLTDDPVAVVCSSGEIIHFAVMSKALRQRSDLTWIRKGTGLSARCATATFNRDPDNVSYGRRLASTANLGDWFTGGDGEINEEVVGLGEYGRTLTVLWADDLPDPSLDEDAPENEDEMLLPSERFYRKTRYD
jgi:Zn-dependent peptidase ImmA (M78 family)